MVDLRPLRESRDFRLLFSGQLISMFGTQLTLTATNFQVYAMTHSIAWNGTLSLVRLPPLLIGSLWGGAVGDRVDRRNLMTLTSLVLGFFSVGLALNAHGGGSLLALILLSVVASFVAGFANPARNASIPRLVKSDQLVGAYSINQIVIQSSSILGPMLGGVLIWAVGLQWCYWIDGASFVALAIATSRMNPLPPLTDVRTSTLRAIGDGFSYVRSHTLAQCVYLIDLNAMIFGMPNSLFPALALTWFHGGSITYGALLAAPSIGAFIGAFTTGWVERISRRGRAVTWAVIVWGAAIALFGLWRSLAVAMVFLAIAGWADVISAVLRNTILQSTITDEFRGRLSSIQMAVVQGGPQLGNAEAGYVAAAISPEFSIVSGGLACVVGAALIAKWRPQFWRESAMSIEPTTP